MIAVTFALPYESKAFRAALHKRLKADNRMLPVAVWHTGVGMHVAESAVARHLMTAPRPEALVSLGFAGGLDASLKTADLVICRRHSDGALQQRLAGRARLRLGILHTAPSIVETAAEKSRLRKDTGAGAVDMEAAGIERACQHHGIPMLAIRAISDPAGLDLPVPAGLLHDPRIGRPRYWAMGRHLIARPRSIPQFLAFAAGAKAAQTALASLLDELLVLHNDLQRRTQP